MNNQDVDRPVTLGTLLDFTDEVLLPRLSDLIDKKLEERLKEYPKKTDLEDIIEKKLADFEGRMATKFVTKSYLDDKLADVVVEITKRVERRLEREQKFRFKITEILRKSRIANPEDIAELEKLIQ